MMLFLRMNFLCSLEILFRKLKIEVAVREPGVQIKLRIHFFSILLGPHNVFLEVISVMEKQGIRKFAGNIKIN